jgi:hypothetical protein
MACVAAIGGLMRRTGLVALLVVCGLAWAGPEAGLAQPADSGPITQRSIKAAFLCKFASYVEWPGSRADAGGPLTIGVLESSAMADELVRITAGRTINDRPVRIRRLTPGDPLEGLHMLFVGTRDSVRLVELLQPARAQPILTITETAGALADGSIINFTSDQERVRFEVSLPAAERSGLKLSSRLLAVAQRVKRSPES